jgi:hypothetical protein
MVRPVQPFRASGHGLDYLDLAHGQLALLRTGHRANYRPRWVSVNAPNALRIESTDYTDFTDSPERTAAEKAKSAAVESGPCLDFGFRVRSGVRASGSGVSSPWGRPEGLRLAQARNRHSQFVTCHPVPLARHPSLCTRISARADAHFPAGVFGFLLHSSGKLDVPRCQRKSAQTAAVTQGIELA